ncbi:MAG: family transposase, partial [Massilia sp.]|nr:family transposase [Massilia sp.]
MHGNHEAYGRNLEDTQAEIREACEAAKNVHFLDCDEYVLGNVRFLGATLWTDFRLFGDEARGIDARSGGRDDGLQADSPSRKRVSKTSFSRHREISFTSQIMAYEKTGRAVRRGNRGDHSHGGLKELIGADAASGLVHTVIATAGNVSDVTQAHALLHGDEVAAMGDAGCQGVEKCEENLGKNVTWHVAMKRARRKALPANKFGRMTEKLEHLKASVRSKVEHPFHVVKNAFRHRRARYRGLAKNTAQLFILFGFANLVLAGRQVRVSDTRV